VAGSEPSAKPPSNRILQLDGLRGMAILLVIFYHYIFTTTPAPQGTLVAYLQAASRIGWSGVDLFFILSGFLIGGILLDARDSNSYFRTFYLRRIHRIFPIYYLWIGIYFLVAFTPLVHWSAPLGIMPRRWTIIPVYALFLQNMASGPGHEFRPVWLAVLWSLAVEEQFYLVVPSVVRFLSRRGLVVSLILTILGAPLIRILVFRYLAPTHAAAIYMLTPCRADALAMGALLAVVWRVDRYKAWIQAHLNGLYGVLAVLAAGIGYLMIAGKSEYSYTMAVWGYSCVDLFFAGIVLLALIVPRGIWAAICRWPMLIGIGGISYCIYIIHSPINRFCHFVLSPSANGISTLPSLGATLIAAAITWLVAKMSWRYLESPMIRLGHQYKYSRRAAGLQVDGTRADFENAALITANLRSEGVRPDLE
jgi:peptidoglycan/LPS O-acetylase OafA/YrhL